MSRKKRDVISLEMFAKQFLPAFISCIFLAFAEMADSVVLGKYGGAAYLAALAIVVPFFMVFDVIMHGLGLGGSVHYAKLMASHKKLEARAVFKGIVLTTIWIGIAIFAICSIFAKPILIFMGGRIEEELVFSAAVAYFRVIAISSPVLMLSYVLNYFLRNDDLEKEASLCSSIAYFFDVVLNVVFVIIWKKGATGAATATFCGYAINVLFSILIIIKNKSNLNFREVKADFKSVFGCFKVGFSNSSWYIGDFVFMTLANNILVNTMDYMGIAVFGVIQNITYLFIYTYRAVCQASQPIFSTYDAEKNRAGEKYVISLNLKIALILGMGWTIIISSLSVPICQFFGIVEQRGLDIGKVALTICCFGELISCIAIVYENYFESKEEIKPAYIISLLRGLLILTPVTILCSLTKDNFFWMLYPITEIVSLLVFVIIYKIHFSKKSKEDEARICRFLIKNSNQEISEVNEFINEFMEKWEIKPKQSMFVQMTIEELCVDIIKNGFVDGKGFIQITVIIEENGDVKLFLRDNAHVYNPFEQETAAVSGNDDAAIDSVGIHFVKNKSKEFYYRRYQGFNSLCVVV